MKLQNRVISEYSFTDFEFEVNEFLRSIDASKIVDIKSFDSEGSPCCQIIYIEGDNNNEEEKRGRKM